MGNGGGGGGAILRLDDFGPRLRNLSGPDLDHLWRFVKSRWDSKQRVLQHITCDSFTQVPGVLSELSQSSDSPGRPGMPRAVVPKGIPGAPLLPTHLVHHFRCR